MDSTYNKKIEIIKQEIENERKYQRCIDEYDIATGLRKAIEIINKHIQTDTEGTNTAEANKQHGGWIKKDNDHW